MPYSAHHPETNFDYSVGPFSPIHYLYCAIQLWLFDPRAFHIAIAKNPREFRPHPRGF